jgi:hypothetical protein
VNEISPQENKTEYKPSFLSGSGSISVSNLPIAFIRPKFNPLKNKYKKIYEVNNISTQVQVQYTVHLNKRCFILVVSISRVY